MHAEEIIPALHKALQYDGTSINLARTSLAMVHASSCNGDRPLSNKYYGILNAFDQGSNLVNNINYSDWLPKCTQQEWVEVEFSSPVALSALILEGASQCNATLCFAKGGEKVFQEIVQKRNIHINRRGSLTHEELIKEKSNTSILPIHSSSSGNSVLEFNQVVEGIIKIRLTFTGNNVSLAEFKVMGMPPAAKSFKVGTPHLKVTKADALLEANSVYDIWIEATYGLKAIKAKKISETKNSITYFYKKGDKILAKVVVDKKSGIGRI